MGNTDMNDQDLEAFRLETRSRDGIRRSLEGLHEVRI